MANNKYAFLKNHEWIKDQLLGRNITVMQLAEELGEATGNNKQNLHGSITFLINRWFTDDEKSRLKRGRKTNRKKTDKTE